MVDIGQFLGCNGRRARQSKEVESKSAAPIPAGVGAASRTLGLLGGGTTVPLSDPDHV